MAQLTSGNNAVNPFEKNQLLDDMAEAAYQAAESCERGGVLRWEEVESAAGIPRYVKRAGVKQYSTHWQSVIRKFRELMAERRGMILEGVPGVGLRFYSEHDQIYRHSKKRLAKVRTQHRRIYQGAEILDTAGLPENLIRGRLAVMQIAEQGVSQAEEADVIRRTIARHGRHNHPATMPVPA